MHYQSIFNRLRRIEGQIRGIEEMVANDRREQDILIQLEAAKASLSSAITSLVEKMLDKNIDGKIVLDQEKLDIILRSIRNK